MLDRRNELKVQAEKFLDILHKGHGTSTDAIAAALCTIAWNQLEAQASTCEIDLESDPYAIERAIGREPNCDHETGASPICKKCGWDIVIGEFPGNSS